MIDTIKEYNYWLGNTEKSYQSLYDELNSMRWDDDRIKDCFCKNLEFGTSGLRGIMGAGTNRINEVIVRKVSQGISSFLRKTSKDSAVVIAYDTRENSFEYAVCTAEVFAGNGIPVYMFDRTVPVSLLSYVIPRLGASLGVMITASHNSREYNGYKVYGAHGHQILSPIPEMILDEISKIDEFKDVKSMNINEAVTYSLCAYVKEELIESFYQDISSSFKSVKPDRKIVYTPLNGAGLEFVTGIYERNGIKDLIVVENQIVQDGKFETCPYPNPEIKDAFNEAIKTANIVGASYIIATDPDCDRFGMAVKTGDEFRVLTGNEIGILMFNYIVNTRKTGRNAYVYKSIVTSPLIDRIAYKHKVKVKDLLIGFKYIGEKVYNLDSKKKYVFGMEESHGYLIGPYCWDKDAVGASLMAAAMIDYYKDIPSALDKIYAEYGYIESSIYNFSDYSYGGKERIINICNRFRNIDTEYIRIDFMVDDTGLEKADILKFYNDKVTVYIRPSGTEPKLKIYIFAMADTREKAREVCNKTYDWFVSKVNELS